MKDSIRCAITAFFALAASAVHAQTPERYLTHAEWERKPQADQMAEIAKRTAGPAETVGWALMKCRVDAQGRLSPCKVVVESPDSGPIGRIALRLAPIFKLKPVTKEGEPVEGGIVLVPIAIASPDKAIPPMSYTPGRPSYTLVQATENRPGVTRILCPLGSDKTTICEANEFFWEKGLRLDESAPIILATEQTTGVSTLFCQFTAAGRFENCQIDGENNPRILAAVSKILAKLKSPKRFWSDEPVAPASIAMVYDWAVLTKAARAVTVPLDAEEEKAP
jgi:hypothetical protein